MDNKEINEAEVTVVTEEPKKKKPWKPNVVVASIFTLIIVFASQIAGILVVQMPVILVFAIKYMQIPGNTFDYIAIGEYVSGNITPFMEIFMMYLMTIGAWVVCLLVFLIKKNRPIFKTFTTKIKGNNVKNLFIGFGVGFGMNAFCILIAYIHGDISLSFESFEFLPLVLLLLAVGIQSSSEELICRGYLYQKIMARHNSPVLAILVNGCLFAALHLFNSGVTVLAIANIAVIGIMFSLMVYYWDSLWAAMAAHTAWNFTQNIIFGLPNSGMMSPYSIFVLDQSTASDSFAYNVGFGVEGTVLAVALLIVVTLIILFAGIKKGPKATNIWEA